MSSVDAPVDPVEAEARFLADLRERVAWQSHEAARQRAENPAFAPVDLLDIGALHRLVEANPQELRAAEWRAFLAELEVLTDRAGRLPGQLERLVRVVLADLLE